MKFRSISLFYLAGALESLVLLTSVFIRRSHAENALFAGLSGPRLMIAALLAGDCAGFGVLLLLSRANPSGLERRYRLLDARLQKPENLIAVSACLLVLALIIPAAALAGILAGYEQVVIRLIELLILVESLAVLGLVFLWREYALIYRQPDFFHGFSHKLARAVFSGKWSFWLSIVLVAITAIILVPSSSISMRRVPGHDSGIFLYFGRQILHGDVPFRDLWDHKPPGIFWTNAFGLLLGNGSAWGVWALEFLALCASSIIGFTVLRRAYGVIPAFVGVSLSLAYLIFLLEGGNLTEEFSLPLQWGFLLLLSKCSRQGLQGRAGVWRGILAGVLFSLAFNFKQTMVGLWASAFVWLALQDNKRIFWRNSLPWAALGAVLTQASILAYFRWENALGEYWRVAFVYNFVYSDINPQSRMVALSDLFVFLTRASPIFPLAFLAWLAGWVSFARGLGHSRSAASFPLMLALIDLPLELFLISVSGRNYHHYFMTLLPSITILLGWGAYWMRQKFARTPHWMALPISLLVIVWACLPSARTWNVLVQPAGEYTITQTVRLVQAQTQPGETVLVWGSQTVVNFLADRASPSRFVHQKPLFRAGFASRALSEEFLQALTAHPPTLVINTHLPSTPFPTMQTDGTCIMPPNLPEGMDAVFAFLCERYTLDAVITKDRWEIYRLKDE